MKVETLCVSSQHTEAAICICTTIVVVVCFRYTLYSMGYTYILQCVDIVCACIPPRNATEWDALPDDVVFVRWTASTKTKNKSEKKKPNITLIQKFSVIVWLSDRAFLLMILCWILKATPTEIFYELEMLGWDIAHYDCCLFVRCFCKILRILYIVCIWFGSRFGSDSS